MVQFAETIPKPDKWENTKFKIQIWRCPTDCVFMNKFW